MKILPLRKGSSARGKPENDGAVTVRWADGDIGPDGWPTVRPHADSEHAFLSHTWFEAWGKHFLPRGNWRGPLRYLTAMDDARHVVGVLPLAVQSAGGIRFGSLGGYYQPFRSIPVANDLVPDICSGFARFLSTAAPYNVLRFGPVSSTDRAMTTLIDALAAEGWRIATVQVGLQYTTVLPRDVAAFEAMVGKEFYKKSRYYQRRMANDYRVRVELYHGSGTSWPEVVRNVARIESRSWLVKQGHESRFSDCAGQQLWCTLLSDGSFADLVDVWILFADDVPVSFCFTFVGGTTRYVIANNYDEAFSRYSTGSILYECMFRHSIDAGLLKVNIGLGDSGYKRRWGAAPDGELQNVFAFGPTFIGRCLGLGLRFPGVWRRALGQTPSPVARAS